MSHVTNTHESCRIYEWDKSHIRIMSNEPLIFGYDFT